RVDGEIRRANSGCHHRIARCVEVVQPWHDDTAPAGGRGVAAVLPQSDRTGRDFAIAHARLSTVYGNLGEGQLSRDEIQKAYALRERVSEPERLYIMARYYTTVEGSAQKTIETYQVWTRTYPKEFVPRANLAVAYQNRGENEKAADE